MSDKEEIIIDMDYSDSSNKDSLSSENMSISEAPTWPIGELEVQESEGALATEGNVATPQQTEAQREKTMKIEYLKILLISLMAILFVVQVFVVIIYHFTQI